MNNRFLGSHPFLQTVDLSQTVEYTNRATQGPILEGERAVTIYSPEVQLEARYFPCHEESPKLALLLHPHAAGGGSMSNAMMYYAFHMFARLGFSVLRFNFRGVGNSTGSHTYGEGELRDAIFAFHWLLERHLNPQFYVVFGFGFGALMGMQLLMRRPQVTNFVSISSPHPKADFSFLNPCPVPGLFVHGEKDQEAPFQGMQDLVLRLASQKNKQDVRLVGVEGADQYFTGYGHSVVKHVIEPYVRDLAQQPQIVHEHCTYDPVVEASM